MPELPDITVYLEALEQRLVGQKLLRLDLLSPFVLRSVSPAIDTASGQQVVALSRLGKRIVITLTDDLHLVLHLMIAGRLRWRPAEFRPPRRGTLAVFAFANGVLQLTEAGSKKRASLHLVRGAEALAEHDPGGLEVLQADLTAFTVALARENHTLKRALTDPRLLSGIGNAYSDEILHRAGLSPFKQTSRLDDEETARLYRATQEVLTEWTQRLRLAAGGSFPDKVTAFHPEMAVHGRYGQPCPQCGTPVQRIVYAQNEANYCARCQTGGRLLADRSLSRLLKEDWPRSIEELEQRRRGESNPL